MQQQKNRVEVQGNNLHFPLFQTMQNANYSPEPRLCSFVAAQFETSLLCTSIVSSSSWDNCKSEEKIKIILMQIFEGQAKSIMVFLILVTALQKPSMKSKAKDHQECLTKRLALWKEGEIKSLLREGRSIQKRILKTKRAKPPDKAPGKDTWDRAFENAVPKVWNRLHLENRYFKFFTKDTSF